MNKKNALLRGLAVFGGLAVAQAGWGQATMQPTAPANAPQTGTPTGTGQPLAPGVGQTGTPTIPTGDLQPGGRIAKITIQGNKNVSTDAIQAVLTEKVGDTFDAQTAEKDRLAITAMGYWAGTVQLANLADANGGVDLTFSVVENPVITAIDFNANTPTGEPTIPAATLLAQMQTKPGQVLNMPQLQRDLNTLFAPDTGYASRQGYRFEAGSSINIDPTTGVLTIPVVESYVQAVLVAGNSRVKTADILSEIGTRPGDVYNAQAVQRDQARLSGMGRFATVGQIRVEPTISGRVVLTIPVTEKR